MTTDFAPRALRVALTALVALLAAGGLVACSGGGDSAGDRSAGPLESDVAGGRLGIEFENGRTFATGYFTVSNTGEDDLTFESVEFARAPEGVEPLGTFIGGLRRGVTEAAAPWPRERQRFKDRHPVKGFVLPPADELGPQTNTNASIAFVLKPTGDGKYPLPKVDVRYRIGERAYERRIDPGILVCTYPGEFRDVDCVQR